MPEYHFRGSVTLNGADFYISAPTRERAIELAKLGSFDDAEWDAAEIVDCEISAATIRENA